MKQTNDNYNCNKTIEKPKNITHNSLIHCILASSPIIFHLTLKGDSVVQYYFRNIVFVSMYNYTVILLSFQITHIIKSYLRRAIHNTLYHLPWPALTTQACRLCGIIVYSLKCALTQIFRSTNSYGDENNIQALSPTL